jgi:hypothetical protein
LKTSVFSALDSKLHANNVTPFLQTICRGHLQIHECTITVAATRLSGSSRFERWCGVFGSGGGSSTKVTSKAAKVLMRMLVLLLG